MAMTREPIPDCPQPETPIRERAWSDAQQADMHRECVRGQEKQP